ncbi:MAG: type II secretion system protein N [Desulfotignum sp.]
MKYLFVLIHMGLIAAIAYVGAGLFYTGILPGNMEQQGPGPVVPPSADPGAVHEAGRGSDPGQYDAIVKRNLFKVETEKKQTPAAASNEPVKLEPTNLKLTLWGTVTGTSDVWAVIEDKNARQQALYQVGDMVQGARVQKILRHEVILNFQGKDQVLEMQTDRAGQPVAASQGTAPAAMASNKFQAGPMLENAGEIMKQIKFRPYFSQGVPDGLMVYGIRPDSIFRQIGLRNGDIVKDINGTPIVSPADGMNMLMEIQGTEEIGMTVLRRGKIMDLAFPAADYETQEVESEQMDGDVPQIRMSPEEAGKGDQS